MHVKLENKRMGNQKQKWTQEEEEALLKGVAKHGPGKWKNILKDTEFAPSLVSRSNIDLKDKWRNLSVNSSGQSSRERSRTSKVKASPPPNTPASVAVPSSPMAPQNTPSTVAADHPANTPLDVEKNAPRYNGMIFEALSSLKDANGSDTSAIFGFIEQRHELNPDLRRLLSSRLRRLVSQGKLEKVQNRYKIKKASNLGTKPASPNPSKVGSRAPQNVKSVSTEAMEEAATTAAYKVAEAENKSFVASEAVKEATKVAKMAEETESMLRLVREIFERCLHGEKVVVID